MYVSRTNSRMPLSRWQPMTFQKPNALHGFGASKRQASLLSEPYLNRKSPFQIERRIESTESRSGPLSFEAWRETGGRTNVPEGPEAKAGEWSVRAHVTSSSFSTRLVGGESRQSAARHSRIRCTRTDYESSGLRTAFAPRLRTWV